MALGGGGGGSGKWGAHGHGNRGRPYGLMLLLALGAAIFGVMVLHKFRESRVFNLLIQDKDRHILSLHLLLQKERDATKEVKRKVEELKAKANSLRMHKAELNNKLLDMQSVTSSLKEENKVLESAFVEKQNEIKMLGEREMELNREKQNEMNLLKDKEMDSSKDASQVTVLTDLLKQKEAEIEDLKGRLEKPTKIWSVSTDDPSNPPVNFSRNGELSNVDNRVVVEVGGQDDQSEDHADYISESNQNGEVVRGKGDVENSQGSESFSGERVTENTTEMSASSFTDGTMKAEEGRLNVAFGGKEHGKSTDNTPPGKLDKSQDGRSQTILGSRVKGNYGHKHVTKTKRRKIISKDKTGSSTVGLGRVTTRGGESADSNNPHYQNNDRTNKQSTSELNKPGEASGEGGVNKLDNSRYVEGSKGEEKGVVTEEDEERESEAASMTSESTNVVSNHQERKDDGLVTEEKQLGGTRSNLSSNSIGIRIGNQANEVIGQAEDQEAKMISANQYKDTNGDENPAEGMRVAYNPKKEVDGNHETSGA